MFSKLALNVLQLVYPRGLVLVERTPSQKAYETGQRYNVSPYFNRVAFHTGNSFCEINWRSIEPCQHTLSISDSYCKISQIQESASEMQETSVCSVHS